MVTTTAIADERPATARPTTKLVETERSAILMGYKEDATKVDRKKYPKYQLGQTCAGCFLYNGKKGEADALCTAMYRRVVPTGWCIVNRPRKP
jgi:hypothetical protein